MGKSELFSHFADRFEVKRTQAREFFDELNTLAEKELKRSGEFVLPGMVKLVVQKRKARMGRNPATGEAIKIPAKTVVKARIAKQLKDAVLPRSKGGVAGVGPANPLARWLSALSSAPGTALAVCQWAGFFRASRRGLASIVVELATASVPRVDDWAVRPRRRAGRRAAAVNRRRRQSFDLRLQAAHRIVVHDDAVGGVQHDLAAEAPAAADRLLLEILHGVAVPFHFDLGHFHGFAEHVLPPSGLTTACRPRVLSRRRASAGPGCAENPGRTWCPCRPRW